jgi:hypothetical protein
VVLDGDPVPMRVRLSYLTDHDIIEMATTYTKPATSQVPEQATVWRVNR